MKITVEELTTLKTEIKELIINTLNVSNVRAEEVQDSVPLFSPENILDLDSIDAIELVMAIQEKYQVRIADQNVARNVLESIDSIADFIITEKGL
jgi:acyl carrier protein